MALMVLMPRLGVAQTQQQPAPILLAALQQVVALDGKLEYWVDDTGRTTAAQVAQMNPGWKIYQNGLIVEIDKKKLWLRITVDGTQASEEWWLDLHQPWLDKISLNVLDAQGQWLVKRSGDMVPHSEWSHVSRTPRLQLPLLKSVNTYYVSVEHARVAYPVRVSLQSNAYVGKYSLFEELFFGVCMGVALLVVLMAASLAWAWRDVALARFGVYFLCASLTVMSRMGLNSLLLWPEAPELNAWVGRLLPLLGIASALWFLHAVVRRDEYMPRLEGFLLGFSLFALSVGLVEMIWPSARSFMVAQMSGLLFSVVIALVFVLACWRGNRHTRLLSMGMLPMVVASLFVVMRNAGVQPAGYEIGQFAAIAGLALQTPILLYALIRQAQMLREQRVHEGNIDRVDALTGLSTYGVLEFNLRGSMARAVMNKSSFMLMVVELTNHQAIHDKYGAKTADQAMQTLGGMLRQLRRGVDTAATVQANACAMLLEQKIMPSIAINTATSLLVRSMQPSKNLPKDLQLKLRISLATMPDPLVHEDIGDQPGDCISWMLVNAQTSSSDNAKPIVHLNF